MRATHQAQAAALQHPADLLGEQQQRRHRRGVVGLILQRVLERRGEREELRDPASRARQARDPLLRGGAEQRQPQPAVGSEALLGREVVGVGRRERPRAGPRRRRWRRSGPARPRRPAGARTGTITPVEVSLCAQASTSAPSCAAAGPQPAGSGRIARIGGDHQRLAQEGRAGGDRRELRRELAVGEVGRAALDEPEGRRVPEGRGAAVAERHLIAVRGGEELAQPRADLARRGTSPAAGDGRCPSRRRRRPPGARAPAGAPSTGRSRSARRGASGLRGSRVSSRLCWGSASCGAPR